MAVAKKIAERAMHTRRLKTRREAAEYLGVGMSTLSRWAAERRGPAFVKLADGATSPVRYDVLELDAFIEARRISPK